MKIHEYQAKEIFRRHNIATPEGKLATTLAEARAAAEELGGDRFAVKAQIHAGGRGKAGGIRLVATPTEAEEAADAILGKPLVTHQTSPEGKVVEKLLIEKGIEIERELYLGVTIDRSGERPAMIACAEGGIEIEQIAKSTPDAIKKAPFDSLTGLLPFQARSLFFELGIDRKYLRKLTAVMVALAQLFLDCDASLVEINPLVLTPEGDAVALDAKINFDDNALFRHKEHKELRDESEENPLELKAKAVGISYVKLSGSIGCMVNGAGLAMATMDLIKLSGAEPANFLDVGGGASASQVEAAFNIITNDKDVRAIFVNIFGGIARCDVIAQGIIQAASKVNITRPLIVRLQGTNEEEGLQMLRESDIDIRFGKSMKEAAELAVSEAAKEGNKLIS